VLLSGLSGGGKTAAAKLFEDLAYTVVDNLPGELLPNLAELVLSDGSASRASRSCSTSAAGDAETAYRAMRGALEGRGIRPQVFFLEASDEALIRRFSETRHRHPLANGRSTQAAIALERRLLDPIGPRRTSSSTPRTCRCASSASGCSRASPTSSRTR
jgi:UPF0042 nucleotide-binding protein